MEKILGVSFLGNWIRWIDFQLNSAWSLCKDLNGLLPLIILKGTYFLKVVLKQKEAAHQMTRRFFLSFK